MALSFPHATRAIQADRIIPLSVALVGALMLLIAWGGWFGFAPIPVTVTCHVVQVNRSGSLQAACPEATLRQIRQGMPAEALSNVSTPPKAYQAEVLRVADRLTPSMAPNTVEIYIFAADATTVASIETVQITVATTNPLAVLLKRDQLGYE